MAKLGKSDYSVSAVYCVHISRTREIFRGDVPVNDCMTVFPEGREWCGGAGVLHLGPAPLHFVADAAAVQQRVEPDMAHLQRERHRRAAVRPLQLQPLPQGEPGLGVLKHQGRSEVAANSEQGRDKLFINHQGDRSEPSVYSGVRGGAVSDPGVTFTTPPSWMDLSGSNFQGVIRSCERLSSNI